MSDDRQLFDDLEIGEIAIDLDAGEPEEVIDWAIDTFADDRLAVVTALQAEGMVIVDLAVNRRPDVRILTVDTLRLPGATVEFIDEVHAALSDRPARGAHPR